MKTEQSVMALQVLKGAVHSVLGAPLTSGTKYKPNGKEGVLKVKYSGDSPTQEQLEEIHRKANDKAKENVAVEVLQLGREEAEKRFADKVNGIFIYDCFPIPPTVTEFTVCHIPNWNVNVDDGPFASSTGAAKRIAITKYLYRKQKEIELWFRVLDEGEEMPSLPEVPAGKEKKSGDKVTTTKESARPEDIFKHIAASEANDVEILIQSMTKQILSRIADSSAATTAEEAISSSHSDLVRMINSFRSTMYTHGFTAAKGGHEERKLRC